MPGLIVDESHALGTFGEEGRGLCARVGVVPDVLIGTFGKAFGCQGAFAAGAPWLRKWLWNRARSFVFSTATSPLLTAHILERLASVRKAKVQRQRIAHHSQRLRAALASTGRVQLASSGPIIPLIVGEEATTVALSATLLAQGILVQPIRPPTVPQGTSRLRITLNAAMTELDVDRLANALLVACQDLPKST